MTNSLAIFAASLFLAGCATSAPPAASAVAVRCPHLPGADEILAMDDKRYIVFGEIHGTVEAPALFGDFVCAAARRGPIVVGLEIDHVEQPALDAFLASDGSATPRQLLRASFHWDRLPDGRASEAMFALVERLRSLKAAGLPISVLAFVPRVPPAATQTPYEQAMAAAWSGGLTPAPPGTRFVALVGQFHARRTPDYGSEPAVMHLSGNQVLTLAPAPAGGSGWNCRREGCRVYAERTQIVPPRGISAPQRMSPAAGPFDLWYSPGRPFTASPPVNPNAAVRAAPPPRE